jgi:Glycosyl hydrolase catalytic core
MPTTTSRFRRSPLRRPLRALLLVVLGLVLIGPAVSPADAAVRFGYGEGRADMFSDPRWQDLGMRDVRRLVEFDVRSYPEKIAALDAWMAGAEATNSRVLLAIDHSWTPGRLKAKPTVGQYSSLIRWLYNRYPEWNRLTPWNEVNHNSQPTYKNPKLAWQFYIAAKAACQGCVITSPSILAGKTISRTWLGKFRRYEKGRIRLWAVHNYGDNNRGDGQGLRWFQTQVRGRIWITEAAGWVQFLGGRYPYDERRAATAITRTFRMARTNPRIDLVFFYQWRGTDDRTARWDSGVLNADGSPRLGYQALVRGLAG